MRKSDKKIENQLRISLTDVCNLALKNIEGFQWLTHLVDYANFPKSLKVVCVFDTNESLDNYLQSQSNNQLQSLVKSTLNEAGIKLNNSVNQVLFDTEENCDKQHQGNWAKRLKN